MNRLLGERNSLSKNMFLLLLEALLSCGTKSIRQFAGLCTTRSTYQTVILCCCMWMKKTSDEDFVYSFGFIWSPLINMMGEWTFLGILFPSSHHNTVPSTKETTHQSSVRQPISSVNMYLSSRQKVIVAPFLSQSFIKWKFFQIYLSKNKCTNKYKCNRTKMGRLGAQHYNTLPDYKTGAWVTLWF